MDIDKKFLLDNLDFTDYLNEEDKKLLLENVVKINYKKGELLFSPLFECIGAFLVKKGSLKVYIISEDGREITLYKLEEKDFCVLSASCVLQSISQDVYIEAIDEVEVYMINIQTFSKLLSSNVMVENYSLNCTVSKFSNIISGMEKILFNSIDSRLSEFLLKEGEDSNIINITHEEIASFIGSAREVVSRTLKRFAKKGLIEQKRGQIKILNSKALEDIL